MPFKDYVLDLVGVGVSAGLTYTFYHLVRAGKEVVSHLKDAPDLEINSNLIGQVAESGGSLIACVRGVVKASDNALKGVARPEVTGVIWRHTIQEHLVAQVMGLWMNDKLTVDSSMSSVPFMLMNKGIGVQIADPQKLDDVTLTVVSEKFDAATNSLADHVWGWMKGVRSTGTQQTEEMLVEGTSVLGIGQLLLKNDSLHLEHADIVPYLITTKSKMSVIEDLEAPIPYIRILGLMTAFGVITFSYRVVSRWYIQWRKDVRRRAEERILEDARARREAQGNDLPESLMCVVCCDLRDVLLMPCRHVCVCSECARKLNPRACPVCRTDIESIQPVFYS
ncbi:mitochondrial E3 ubiquitin protein ligase 1 [Procambarus clarkii]|uniref:mitochondrial E3 ubiquitin protein ligase 1 n=1 Tax=Procambarus clarkii TaxID=6728 RepID=UPI001E677CFB|nr:mitochondrial E3 ubiquitin protein ligase 1-like [Procambarus clarkii]